MSDKWNDRAERFEDKPFSTGLKWTLAAIAFIAIIAVVWGVVSWVGGWGSEVKRVTGAENTRQQAFALRDDYRSLEATAGNVCDIQDSKSSSDDPTLVENPSFAYRAKYRDIQRDYNRRMDNAFEAGWVRHYPFLNDLPREAPTLNEMTQQVC